MKTKVIGLGNILMGDDGIGIHVVNKLLNMEFPSNIEVVDAGNCGWGLLGFLEDADKVILVDAVTCGQTPGSITKLDPTQLKLLEKDHSPHNLTLLETLELGRILGYKQKVLLIGVTPEKISFNTQLSPPLKAAIPQIIESIMEELPVENRAGQSSDN